MNKPLVSVLIPLYNHESFVEFAIESVMEQTYNNIELIVINDGSTDNSDEVVQKLLVKYSFQYFKQENKGLIFTIEKLRTLAKGKYISLLASDDAFVNNKIEILVNYLENNPQYSMVYSNMSFMDINNNIIGNIKDGGKEGFIFEDLLCGNFFINSLTTLLRKDIYMLYEYEKGYIEDLQMWLKISKEHQIGFVNQTLAKYRIGNNSSLSNNIEKMHQAENEIISKYFSEKIFPKAISCWNIRWFNGLILKNRNIALKKYFFKIIFSKYSYTNIKFYKSLVKIFYGKQV